jgi:hypothetical protein
MEMALLPGEKDETFQLSSLFFFFFYLPGRVVLQLGAKVGQHGFGKLVLQFVGVVFYVR